MKFLAILRDSLREAIDAKVFYVMIGLSTLLIGLAFTCTFKPRPGGDMLIAPGRGASRRRFDGPETVRKTGSRAGNRSVLPEVSRRHVQGDPGPAGETAPTGRTALSRSACGAADQQVGRPRRLRSRRPYSPLFRADRQVAHRRSDRGAPPGNRHGETRIRSPRP